MLCNTCIPLIYSLFFSSSPVVDCGVPPSVFKGVPHYSSTVYQSIVNYTCPTGYHTIGKSTITCQSNGEWETVRARCESKYREGEREKERKGNVFRAIILYVVKMIIIGRINNHKQKEKLLFIINLFYQQLKHVLGRLDQVTVVCIIIIHSSTQLQDTPVILGT